MNNPPLTCFQGVAHPWLCDEMGHMNTRNYVGMFDDAMQHFFRRLGHDGREAREKSIGLVDVRHEIDYVSEVPLGALVHIDCSLERLGRKSIRYRQVMYLSDTACKAAVNFATSVLFDLKARRAIPVPEYLKEYAGEG